MVLGVRNMAKSSISVDFYKFISSISLALDLAESCSFKEKSDWAVFEETLPGYNSHKHNFASHSKKTALISMYIGRKMNYDTIRLNNLFISSFLHDIGAVDAFSACHSDKSFIYEHSEFGSEIVKKLPVDSKISDFIRYHHDNHDGSGPNRISGSSIPEEAQIIHIADLFELMYHDNIPYRYQRDKLINWVRSKKNILFSPAASDALLEAAASERFWLDIENVNVEPDILNRMHPKLSATVDLCSLTDIARVFATIIDRKSSFTHEHSIGLTDHAVNFARYYGFDGEKTEKLRISALLHDLGKLSIPNSILDKPGKLTREEYDIIKSHTYYTKLILGKIDGMEDITEWASNHHETLRGTGYPEGLNAEKLSLESRIMTVCDIYQALTERRPYRNGIDKSRALAIIDSLVARGDIDGRIVKALKDIV